MMNKTITEEDVAYWNNYYKEQVHTMLPTDFAVTISELIDPNRLILDLGCGNGRDSIYFNSLGHTVVALDSSIEALNKVREHSQEKIITVLSDFSKLDLNYSIFDIVYSRFSLHSMDSISYLNAIKNAYKSLKNDGLFFIEVRSTKDELFEQGLQITDKIYKTDHSRRFFDLHDLTEDLKDLGFIVYYSQQSRGWAVFGDDDPEVIRVFCQKIV